MLILIDQNDQFPRKVYALFFNVASGRDDDDDYQDDDYVFVYDDDDDDNYHDADDDDDDFPGKVCGSYFNVASGQTTHITMCSFSTPFKVDNFFLQLFQQRYYHAQVLDSF